MSLLLGGANAIMSQTLIETFGLSSTALGLMSSAYLMTFGFMQFPLGVMLDRYGARTSLAPLLLFAVAGSLLFGVAQNTAHLVAARALLGVGLAGCTMAAFKCYADWLPAERLPVAYSLQTFAGGLGAMAATRPLALLFERVPWRGVFAAFALAVFAIALAVWRVVPEKSRLGAAAERSSFAAQFAVMLGFLADRRFWYIAPLAAAMQGVLYAYLNLWLGPWLRDVAAVSGAGVGNLLFFSAAGAAAGYLLNGAAANLLAAKGWLTWEGFYLSIGAAFTLLLGLISLGVPGAQYLWPPVIFFAAASMISFPLMRTLFGEAEVGRVLSLLNFLIFFASFVMQWFVGAVLDLFPAPDAGFAPTGYTVGLWVLTAVNAVAVAFFVLRLWRTKRGSDF